jgi:hypothetical protein
MSGSLEPVRQLTGIDPRSIPDAVACATEPLVLKGLVADWPAVRAGAAGAADYLRGHYRDATVGAWFGPPGIEGRFFYNDDLTGFNFRAELSKLDAVLDAIERHRDDVHPPAIYVGSTTVDTCLPGFRAENDLGLGDRQALMSIWIGNRTRIAAHHDLPDNLACVVAGHRRFTVLPPEELENLYIGPLDFTPAGQSISLVDFRRPDLARFPRFARALDRARVAELDPGDALFIPSMWWHHVEALDALNVLVNYWWRRSPDWMDAPINALMLAILSVRDLPVEQRAHWQHLFRHYVFEAGPATTSHIPEPARGVLAPLDASVARALRAQLLRKLNR